MIKKLKDIYRGESFTFDGKQLLRKVDGGYIAVAYVEEGAYVLVDADLYAFPLAGRSELEVTIVNPHDWLYVHSKRSLV